MKRAIICTALCATGAGPLLSQRVPQEGPPPLTLSGHALGVTSVAASGARHLVVSSGLDGTIRVWRPPNPSPLILRPHRGEIYAVALSPSANQIVSAGGDSHVAVTDVATGARRLYLTVGRTWCTAVAWSPDGARLAAGCVDATAKIWDASSGKLLAELKSVGGANGIAWAPDGSELRTSRGSFDSRSGTMRRRLPASMSPARAFAISPDGNTAATATTAKAIRLVGAESDSVRTMNPMGFAVHTDSGWVVDRDMQLPQTAVAFSPNGACVVSGGADRIVRIWDAATGAPLATQYGHTMTITGLTYLDDRHLVSASLDATVRIWEVDQCATRGSKH